MADLERLENYFKPEARKNGADYLRKQAVRLLIKADTQIQAQVKASTPAKVSFVTDSIASPVFRADCSCPASSRGVFCKHMWATLLQVDQAYPDFLDSKTEIEKISRLSERPLSHKAKQSDYRKEQYQKQKSRATAAKRAEKAKRHQPPAPAYPEDVTSALVYFNENGFPLGEPIDFEQLKSAKKKLARFLHPDRGGSHDEFLTLNLHSDVILQHLGLKIESE